jgi:hypothetical protein
MREQLEQIIKALEAIPDYYETERPYRSLPEK